MYTQHIVSPTHSCICSPSHSSSLTSVTVTHCLSLIHHPSPHGYSLLFYSFFLSHTLIDSFSPSLVLSVTHVSVSFSAVVSLIPLIQIIIVLTRFISYTHYLSSLSHTHSLFLCLSPVLSSLPRSRCLFLSGSRSLSLSPPLPSLCSLSHVHPLSHSLMHRTLNIAPLCSLTRRSLRSLSTPMCSLSTYTPSLSLTLSSLIVRLSL